MKTFSRTLNELQLLNTGLRSGIIALVFLLAFGCSSSLKMNSYWRDCDIAIDGEYQEWQVAMTYVEKQNVAIAFFNDEQYFYVCLKSADRDFRRQMMGMGFTLWLDPKGGKGKNFGIKFPLGVLGSGMQGMGMMGGNRGQPPDPEAMREMIEASLVDLEIFLPGDDQPYRMPVKEARGIEVKVSVSEWI